MVFQSQNVLAITLAQNLQILNKIEAMMSQFDAALQELAKAREIQRTSEFAGFGDVEQNAATEVITAIETTLPGIKSGIANAKKKTSDKSSELAELRALKARLEGLSEAIDEADKVLGGNFDDPLGAIGALINQLLGYDYAFGYLHSEGLLEGKIESLGEDLAQASLAGKIGEGRYSVEITNKGAPKKVCLGSGVVLNNGTNCITVPSGVTRLTAGVGTRGADAGFEYESSGGSVTRGVASIRPAEESFMQPPVSVQGFGSAPVLATPIVAPILNKVTPKQQRTSVLQLLTPNLFRVF